MKQKLKRVISFLFLYFFIANNSFALQDSTEIKLSFDLGLTRSQNINLWPVLKLANNEDEKKLQILYPLFSKKLDIKHSTKHLHILPFYINDSSAKSQQKYFLSLYYPSFFHYKKSFFRDTTASSYRLFELAPNISLLGFTRSPSGLYVENNFFFFLWYKNQC